MKNSHKKHSKSSSSRPAASPARKPQQRAYFDAAAADRHNEKHFAFASDRDFDSLIREDRNVLCQRNRYEIHNNPYGKGILETFANAVIGLGPMPQLDSGSDAFDTECENKFLDWCKRSDFFNKLTFAEQLKMAMATEMILRGESLIVLMRQPNASRDEVSLRLAVVSASRLVNPMGVPDSAELHDGIKYDPHGRPVSYCLQKADPYSFKGLLEYEVFPASQVIHYFRQDEPDQSRGIPWLSSSISTGAHMRRIDAATSDAMETAANFSGIIKSNDPDINDSDKMESNDVLPVERNALLTLANGYDITQLTPEHPAATYEMFKTALVNAFARPINMPYNVAACNSKDYNYSSGRLDNQSYDGTIDIVRYLGSLRIINRVFAAWLTEAYLLPDFFENRPTFDQYVQAINSPKWSWTPRKHVDPTKHSRAQSEYLSNGSTTLSSEYAEQGKDWQREMIQRIKEIAFIIKTAAEEEVPLELALPAYLRNSSSKETLDENKIREIIEDVLANAK